MTDPANGSVIEHRRKCSGVNIQEHWIRVVLHLLLESRATA